MAVEGLLGKWEFYRPNFWRSAIAIRGTGNELPIATYERKVFSRKGTVNLPKGERLYIVFYVLFTSCMILSIYGRAHKKWYKKLR